MSSAEPAGGIQVRNLRFSYGERPVLAGVDLSVRPGEIVGLLGPNGSGKSTLVKVLSGVLRPYEGSATLAGRELKDMATRDVARTLAVVPQEPVFGFSFNALEVVLMGRHPHLAGLAFESESDIAKARTALQRCGALEFAHRPVLELSAGERQRVVAARALAQEPDFLLLDEPSSFMDIRHQVELYDLIRDQSDNEATGVMAVLHDLNIAAEYCDRIYLLKEGRILASGPTAEVFTYANLKATFDTDVYVDVNALTGRMLVVPLSQRRKPR
ncbi:MAG: ABC transporter ATP-binding protein [Acidobacteria bacterium]|uniref:ABC transporter ATP-binding protein n=1 Tax=Candidatus Polarisedimenticola svalbardensis TaxID=2886004 RepID=A0A8J6XZ33_9BACT|nr:ABC transporter ATP-binding protein [Candidatus Polarisedimenticola svalbardensis]